MTSLARAASRARLLSKHRGSTSRIVIGGLHSSAYRLAEHDPPTPPPSTAHHTPTESSTTSPSASSNVLPSDANGPSAPSNGKRNARSRPAEDDGSQSLASISDRELASFLKDFDAKLSERKHVSNTKADKGKPPLESFSDVNTPHFPNLSNPDPMMDARQVVRFTRKRGRGRLRRDQRPHDAQVIIRNDDTKLLKDDEAFTDLLFRHYGSPAQATEKKSLEERLEEQIEAERSAREEREGKRASAEDPADLDARLPHKKWSIFEQREEMSLHSFPLLTRRVTQQTGKGKIHRFQSFMIVGNGDGLVGYGQSTHEDMVTAERGALAVAYRNLDYVPRFEKRTIFTQLETKLGSTRIILRPRPIGFGLAVNPHIRRILSAAGVKDCSAKVWGSRRPLNVIKATFRMLMAGNAPLMMGDGIGGKARKLHKGSGVVTKDEVERARGRRLVPLQTS